MELPGSERVLDDGPVAIHRLPIEYSAYFAVQQPATPQGDPSLLVACHGYAQSCKGFIKNFADLRERNWLVAAPQGANQLYWEGGRVGFTWMTRYMREHTIRDNLAYMARFLDVIRGGHAHNTARIFALGFSQGSAMAHRLGAAGLVQPAGVIQWGGDLPPDVQERLGELTPYPVLIVHGREDTQMKFAKAEEGERALRDAGWPVDTIYFDGAHDLPPDIVKKAIEWMESSPNAH